MSLSENSKRIAKNSILLYLRMFFLLLIALYTSRVVLQVLGVTDYGLYNVVGGFVSMLGFLSGSLSGATSRFITFELGLGEKGDVSKIFRCSLTVHYIFGIILFLIAETFGLWFVFEKLVIPDERLTAAFWVYQSSVLVVILSIISVPYNALIIAHEKMGAFAYISIFEAISKLTVVILLSQCESDRLILYSFLLLFVQSFIRFLYTRYCKKNFKESSGKWLWDNKISKKIAYYAGWTLNGDLAVIGYTQGINILLNMFFGPTVNAARGIAVQVQSAVNQFFSNFQMAIRPQVTKSYAVGDFKYMHTLILSSSRYSFYLILIIAVPVLLNTEYIMHLWLTVVPEHTVAFTQLMILACVNIALSQPVIMAIHATGDLKVFQLVEGSILLAVVPVSYVALKVFSVSPEMVFVIYLLIENITQFVRVYIVYPRIKLRVKNYFSSVLFPILKVSLILFLLYIICRDYCSADNLLTFVLISSLSIFVTLSVVYCIGFDRNERKIVSGRLITSIKKIL